MFLKNLKTLLSEPGMGMEFASYSVSRLLHGGQPIRVLPGNVAVTGFSGFGEYHSCAEFVGPEECAFFANFPKAEGDVIDIGANLGIVSVLLSRSFPDRRIHSFEPNPHTIAALRRNLEINNCTNVTAHEAAVADRDGTVSFEAHPTNRATTSISGGTSPHALTVPCTTLDAFMEKEKLEALAFLKVDVEGYETAVFRGAARALAQRNAAMIFFEIAPALTVQAGFAADQPARMLLDAGYQLMRMRMDGSMYPAEVSEIRKIRPEASENWIALRA